MAKKGLNRKEYKMRQYSEKPWLLYLYYAKKRCNDKSDKYCQRGIKCLINKEEIKGIWFRDKAWLLKKPSIDRIKSEGHYTFKNCRFIELDQNRRHSRKILQFDLQGNLIRKWDGIITASKIAEIKYHLIWDCLAKRSEVAGGYIWKYAMQ